jgi:protein-L-isoaspartate O-methyltransferase
MPQGPVAVFHAILHVACKIADPHELQSAGSFDAIHVGASLPQVPGQFVQLLRPGGRLVLPLGAMHGAAAQVGHMRHAGTAPAAYAASVFLVRNQYPVFDVLQTTQLSTSKAVCTGCLTFPLLHG